MALAIVMILTTGITVFAENPESKTSHDVFFDSLDLGYGTIYLEENIEYRVAYIVYDGGRIQYSITYRDNPNVAHIGNYDISTRTQQTHDSIVNILLNLVPEEVVNFATRPQLRGSILTADDAIEFASNYATGWKNPVNSKYLGSYSSSGLTAKIYESINADAEERCILHYYAQDTLVSIASAVRGLSLSKVMKVVTNILSSGGDLLAQYNGTLSYFDIDNTRTKTSGIDGKVYYFAGWDVTYDVYSGDKKTFVERTYNFQHSDYNYSNEYFGQKAIDSYNNPY